jgi:hypothetical protein
VNGISDVDKLLFPVKLGLHVIVMLGALAFGGLATSCGYHSVYTARQSEPLSVVAGEHRIPELSAVEATLGAARAELSRAGALKSGTDYPRVVIEVLRVDEQSLGIAAITEQGRALPQARGSRIAVVGRAWLERAANQALIRDSGDMRRTEQYATSEDPGAEGANREDAVRSAARRLGRALARRILGESEPEIEPL